MKTSLENQIAELREKHNLQSEVESQLPNLKIYTNYFNYKSKGTTKTITVHLNELPLHEIADNIRKVLAAFPPTAKAKLSFAGKDDVDTASEFVLRWDNGVNENKAQIDYVSNETWVHIGLPIKFYSDDVKGSFQRKVYDTEHHYFTGQSYAAIDKIRLTAYKLDMFENIGYYGGDCVSYITDAEDKEEFESVVLTGHTPEFADFRQKQLTSIS